jgi:hypothetical protein
MHAEFNAIAGRGHRESASPNEQAERQATLRPSVRIAHTFSAGASIRDVVVYSFMVSSAAMSVT